MCEKEGVFEKEGVRINEKGVCVQNGPFPLRAKDMQLA